MVSEDVQLLDFPSRDPACRKNVLGLRQKSLARRRYAYSKVFSGSTSSFKIVSLGIPLATSTPMTRFSSDEQTSKDRNKFLLREIAIQQEHIAQAVEAIALCHKKSDLNWTSQELNAQRILLVSNERRLSYSTADQFNEFNLKNVVKSTVEKNEGFDTIDITSVNIYLNRNYYLKTTDQDVSFVFVVLVKCDSQIYATQFARTKTIQVRESIRFDHLAPNFVFTLEVFALKKMRRQAPHKHFSLAPSRLASMAMSFMSGVKKPLPRVNRLFPSQISFAVVLFN
uniref:Anillin homology domain-containing protein n=1 Tax=Ditylenchus dipsaci TaxID=166011 RepID=A0A915E8F5_9BILA